MKLLSARSQMGRQGLAAGALQGAGTAYGGVSVSERPKCSAVYSCQQDIFPLHVPMHSGEQILTVRTSLDKFYTR